MKYITARQAWHDAYYSGKENTMIEFLKLGKAVQKTIKSNSNSSAIHAWLAGRVQNAISTLIYPLQCFGHYLYKPYSNGLLDNMEYSEVLETSHEAIKIGLLLKHTGEQWTDAKFNRVNCIIYACMEEYKKLVLSKKKKFNSYNQTCQWIYGEFGIKIDHTNWHRDWLKIYEEIMDICNEFDKKALIPVTEVINSFVKVA